MPSTSARGPAAHNVGPHWLHQPPLAVCSPPGHQPSLSASLVLSPIRAEVLWQ